MISGATKDTRYLSARDINVLSQTIPTYLLKNLSHIVEDVYTPDA